MSNVKRIYVEKKNEYAVEARHLAKDIKETLGIPGIKSLRLVNRYDISGLSQEDYETARKTVFSEPTVDAVYDECLETDAANKVFAVEYLPGQYDQRADSAAQCVQIMTRGEKPIIESAKVYVISGDISLEEFNKIKNYCINPVDSREASLEKPETLEAAINIPKEVKTVKGFVQMDDQSLANLHKKLGLAMSIDDLLFCRNYFKNEEKRDPTITEIRVIDTYWSDHCRHTTFLTNINHVEIEDGKYTYPIKTAYQNYLKTREAVYKEKLKNKRLCLMDIATIGMKVLKRQGLLNDLDESDEINACSIVVSARMVDNTGRESREKWLVMFKNETHNHPTEIEPFGGAATCLGGAIRDPLSGRAYVYQAMRVTGSGDPRTPVEDTINGKLPQRKITLEAAHGYSSYGNQIGLATGQVTEIYDEGYVAKRMEIGAVVGAVPQKNVVRSKPLSGDLIILLGGRTGRDGCGGATGSSKEHTEDSILTCGAEVQKGNPITERKIQRLFRNPSVSALIKRCNDFGAGGVSVAIGELSDGLVIDLDKVPKKYEGLDGTELAISESQERMAVVVDKNDAAQFINYASEENLEAKIVAEVTDSGRMVMKWRGDDIVDISREFLNTNGATQQTDVFVEAPKDIKGHKSKVTKEKWLDNLKDLNVCSQRGLAERFDGTIGAETILMPFGGKYELTPQEGMVSKLPVAGKDTTTGTVMTFGYDPAISKWSPFHGAVYAVVHAAAKAVAMGADLNDIRLTLQEYFEKPGKDPKRWGKPFGALLGAFYAQMQLNIPAIGGKDSMSGTFMDRDVPPTLVAFALSAVDVRKVISSEFKKAGSPVILAGVVRDIYGLPDFDALKKNYAIIHKLIEDGVVLSASTVKAGGIAETISKMSFGNAIGFDAVGFEFKRYGEDKNGYAGDLFARDYGSIVLEIDKNSDMDKLKDLKYEVIGNTVENKAVSIGDIKITIKEMIGEWQKPLEKIFPTKAQTDKINISSEYTERNMIRPKVKIARPRIFIPIFPGTNCEYDSKAAFEKAGGVVEAFVFNNLSVSDIEISVKKMAQMIKNSQIIMLPGGFSAGDEPDGSGKFIAAVFKNGYVKDAVMDLLNDRDGLVLGICNGFQALIKLGLVPYGEIKDIGKSSPTLTYNTIGRHVSRLVTTKVVSVKSPWFSHVKTGDVHTIPVSHGEGRFVAPDGVVNELLSNGQVATQYVDEWGMEEYGINYNPNGSKYDIEGITSPDGRVLGKMGHSERIGRGLYKNVPGDYDQKIFLSGVEYFI